MQLPSVPEFLTNVYTPDGELVTGERLDALTNVVLPQLSLYAPDGTTPQIEVMVHDAVSDSCRDTANGFAMSFPDVAKAIGHVGLFRIMVACVAEGKGNAPAGYTQQVLAALQANGGSANGEKDFLMRPSTWAMGAGAAVLLLVLLRR